MIASAARELSHLAAVFESVAAIKPAADDGAKHARVSPPAGMAKRHSRAKTERARERVMRDQQARMQEAHAQARRTEPAAAPPPDASDRRIYAIAQRYYDGHGRQPRIRGL